MYWFGRVIVVDRPFRLYFRTRDNKISIGIYVFLSFTFTFTIHIIQYTSNNPPNNKPYYNRILQRYSYLVYYIWMDSNSTMDTTPPRPHTHSSLYIIYINTLERA